MKVTSAALSLNVPDVSASAAFLQRHLGFVVDMEHDGVTSLTRPDVGLNLIFLRTGLDSFKPASHAASAGPGLLIVFVVHDIDDQYARLQAEGVHVVTPIETEPWGERYFQMRDSNGVIYQLVQWMSDADAG